MRRQYGIDSVGSLWYPELRKSALRNALLLDRKHPEVYPRQKGGPLCALVIRRQSDAWGATDANIEAFCRYLPASSHS